jgi:hypothetical protein
MDFKLFLNKMYCGKLYYLSIIADELYFLLNVCLVGHIWSLDTETGIRSDGNTYPL